MLYRLGTFMILLSVVFADNESLVAPAVIVLVGAGLMWLGRRMEAAHEQD